MVEGDVNTTAAAPERNNTVYNQTFQEIHRLAHFSDSVLSLSVPTALKFS